MEYKGVSMKVGQLEMQEWNASIALLLKASIMDASGTRCGRCHRMNYWADDCGWFYYAGKTAICESCHDWLLDHGKIVLGER
jgi:hypothetical protein